ncbi:MAG TPA: Dabb family protein [Burkholderiaceae bacterium]|nr:Dabb family protein [Burkholderiaceae bacterium]
MTIKHIVLWRVDAATEDARQAACQKVRVAFESLAGKIPGLLELEVGIDSSRISYASDVVLNSTFADKESLIAYATHPEHLRVRTELAGVRIESRQVDYACGPVQRVG